VRKIDVIEIGAVIETEGDKFSLPQPRGAWVEQLPDKQAQRQHSESGSIQQVQILLQRNVVVLVIVPAGRAQPMIGEDRNPPFATHYSATPVSGE
jgi:hypothetical protein